MKTLFNSTRKIIFSVMVCLAMLLSCCYSLLTLNNAYAYNYYEKSDVEVPNGDFTSYSKGTKGEPYSLSSHSWTVEKDSNVVAGVISTKTSDFEENNNFSLAENPETDENITSADDYILMFKTSRDEESVRGKGKAVSESATLKADTFYEISIRVKTTNGGQASIYASYDSAARFLSIEGGWQTYRMLVATDMYNKQDFTLTLCYGSSITNSSNGQVFFDHIVVNEISEYDFYNTGAGQRLVKTDLSTDRKGAVVAADMFQNSNFENATNGWTIGSVSGGANVKVGVFESATIASHITSAGYNVTNVARTNAYGNTSSLAFINKDEATVSVTSSEDNVMTIRQHGLYRLSMLIKTGSLSGAFRVTLAPTSESESLEAVTVASSNMTTAMDNYNGFSRLYFYIKGSLVQDETVSIKFEMSNSSGWAIVDDLSLEPISQKEFDDKADSAQTLDLTKEIENTENITNGRFDFVAKNSYDETYPLQPADWTYVGSQNTSGIIRINPSVFPADSAAYGHPANPGVNNAYYGNLNDENYLNENVLMLWNKTEEDVYYKSSTSTMTANSSNIAEYSVGIKTVGTARAFVRVVDSDNNVIAVIDNINTSGAWQMQHLFVKNGISSLTLHLEVGMEGHGAQNEYVFVDCADYASDGSTAYTNADLSEQNFVYTDLKTNNFASHSNKTSVNHIYEDSTFSVVDSSEGSIYYGVVDTRNDASLDTYPDAGDNGMFVISTSSQNYITLKSNYTYSLSKDNYYEFSIWVKTKDLNAEAQSFGALFEVASLDSNGNLAARDESKTVFKNIVTDSEQDNGWTKYSIYLLSESDQKVKVLIGLGDSETYTAGNVYFDGLTVQEVTRAEYSAVEANDTTIVTTVVEPEEEEQSQETNNNNKTTGADINIFAIFSSLMLVAALVLAIVGFIIRRAPKSEKPKKVAKKPTYSKSAREINRTDVSKELGAKRKASVSEIDKQLSTLKAELDGVKAEYESKTSGDEYVDPKEYKEYSLKANKLQDEIDNLESAKAYLTNSQTEKQAEKKEIKRRQKQAEKEFEKLKQDSEK